MPDPATSTTSRIRPPEGIRYQCIQCGRSCGEFWEIPVDADRAEAIRALPLAAMQGVADPVNPVIESPWTPGQPVMRMAGGRCAMRRDDCLCGIHAAFGFDAKPNICRSFPYRFVATPEGQFVGLSFACTAVLGNLGPAVADQSAELAELFGYTHSKRAIPEAIELEPDLPLSWEQYRRIEADLEELLEPGDGAAGPIGRRLIAQAVYLRLLVNLLRETRGQSGALMAGPEANDAAMAALRRRFRGEPDAAAAARPRERPWSRLGELADRGRASRLFRRMFLGFAQALRNTYGQRRGRLRSYAMAIRTYFGFAIGRGWLELPALGRPVRYAELRHVRFDPLRPEFDELLTRYFRHTLWRKDLLLADSVHLGHHMQLMHYGLVEWYATALAAARGRDEVTLDDLTEALRNVEKYFVFHSTFNNLFSRYPLLRGFLDRLFAHPLYAYSLGRGERESQAAAAGPQALSSR